MSAEGIEQYVSLYLGPHASIIGQIAWDYVFEELRHEFVVSRRDTKSRRFYEPLLSPRFCDRLETRETDDGDTNPIAFDGMAVRGLFVNTAGIQFERKDRPWFRDDCFVAVRREDDFVGLIEEKIEGLVNSCERFRGFVICVDSLSSWMVPKTLEMLEHRWASLTTSSNLVQFIDSTSLGLSSDVAEVGECPFRSEVDGEFLCCIRHLLGSGMPVILFQSDHILKTFVHDKLGLDPAHHDLSGRLRARDIVIAKMIASQLTSLRWDSALNFTLSEFRTNYFPFPSFNFLVSSLAPFFPLNKACNASDFNLADVSCDAFDSCSFSAYCNDIPALPIAGKMMAASGNFRGLDFAPKDVGQGVMFRIKRKMNCVDWAPTGFKCSLTYRRPLWFSEECPFVERSDCLMAENSRSVCVFVNTTAIRYTLRAWINGFRGKRTESVQTAIDEIVTLIEEYEDAEVSCAEDEWQQAVDNGEEEEEGY